LVNPSDGFNEEDRAWQLSSLYVSYTHKDAMASQLYSTLSQRDDNDVVYVDGYGNVYSSDSFWYTRVCLDASLL